MLTKSKHHKRIKAHSAADLMPKDKDSTRILIERAKQLAQPKIQDNFQTELLSYVRFRLGKDEFYGIPYQAAKEVINNVTLTKLPFAPAYIAGIMNHRSGLLTILDLKHFFGIQTIEYDKNCFVLAVAHKNITVGILADNIEGSAVTDPATLDPPFSSENLVKPEYLLGLDKGNTAIINIDALMKDLVLLLNKF